MKKIIALIFFCVVFFCACDSTKPLTFIGNTSHWHIEMDASNYNTKKQDINIIFKYTGKMSQIKSYKHLELSFKAGAKSGGQTIDAPNGLTKKEYTITTSSNGTKITKNDLAKATIILGKKDTKETANLVNK